MDSADPLAPLDRRLGRRLIRPGDADYDTARQVWNAMIDRRPAAIARCRSVEDVVAAVAACRAAGRVAAIRGGGHNIAGSAVADDALVIDLSDMRGVTVDPAARIARVQGGALLADLDAAAQAHGLAVPAGVISSTGVAGLTLGGGFGWLSRRFGLAADNLLAVRLVTAAGRVVEATPDATPELFWALRGGGGNFGVAVEFAFRLHAVGPEVLFGPTVFPLEAAEVTLAAWGAFCAGAPREACVWADLLTAPPLPFLDDRHHGRKVLSLMQCWSGDPAEGASVLAPLRELPEAIGDAVAVRPYVEAQRMLDAAYEAGARNYWSASNVAGIVDPLPRLLAERAAILPTPASDILICQLGGAIDDVAPEDSAYPHRGVGFSITAGARWTDPADDARCTGWLRETAAAFRPHAQPGAYVNFIPEGGRTADAFGANLARLAAVKAVHDPENLFRSNQNILPGRSPA
ncbi:FAD-binding oxidoreductase [Paralimibaculum aggregatum]|uniref:FAD-binding oxidoreductase n=1 Tax=Paralimibaculum aggregatum TaxID=3036245 RepID=A0ABQ6LCB5_9RHOB|nr:FAD-binding oxidoreductase [Limibaculum sp. NKW23]GMG81004.1 FAD-binding oxidoreductase [Limibaculum sp. NKW23]